MTGKNWNEFADDNLLTLISHSQIGSWFIIKKNVDGEIKSFGVSRDRNGKRFLTAGTKCLKSYALLWNDTWVSESLFVIVDVEEMEKKQEQKRLKVPFVFFIFTLTY